MRAVTPAERERARDEAVAEILAELNRTHYVFTKDELTELLQRTAVAYLQEGYEVARNVIQAVVDGGLPLQRALTSLDYAAGEGGIMEVAMEQTRDSVAVSVLNHEKSTAEQN